MNKLFKRIFFLKSEKCSNTGQLSKHKSKINVFLPPHVSFMTISCMHLKKYLPSWLGL